MREVKMKQLKQQQQLQLENKTNPIAPQLSINTFSRHASGDISRAGDDAIVLDKLGDEAGEFSLI